MLYYRQEDNRLSGSCQSNRLRLLGHYRMACMNQSASSYGLASWMHPQQGGLPAKKQKSCPYRSKYWGSFSMCILLTVLKHERQQCQYKHTENHKILECKIYHRHHLHSLRMKATPPCTTVVKIILSHKHISVNPLGSGFTPPRCENFSKNHGVFMPKNKEDQELHAGS